MKVNSILRNNGETGALEYMGHITIESISSLQIIKMKRCGANFRETALKPQEKQEIYSEKGAVRIVFGPEIAHH